VSVLYRRCLAGARTDRTWLPAAGVADPPTADWAALHAALSRQTPVAAHEASAALSGAFRDLLGSLIGPALTQQLLHPAPALPTSGSSAQDTTP